MIFYVILLIHILCGLIGVGAYVYDYAEKYHEDPFSRSGGKTIYDTSGFSVEDICIVMLIFFGGIISFINIAVTKFILSDFIESSVFNFHAGIGKFYTMIFNKLGIRK